MSGNIIAPTSETDPVSERNKKLFGEVRTSRDLIDGILDMIPDKVYSDPLLKWLDPCCGDGRFSVAIFSRLFTALEKVFPSPVQREKHILEQMLFMVEINDEHLTGLYRTFGKEANILNADFLSMSTCPFDVIVGNPPFNVAGSIKVPTNTGDLKRGDGVAIWGCFVEKAITQLKEGGILGMITPSIWMKRDNKMHDVILKHRVERIRAMNSSETNAAFRGQAQTPTCYFTLTKVSEEKSVKGYHRARLFDKALGSYVRFTYSLTPPVSLPVSGASVVLKLRPYVHTAGCIPVNKTNMPRKGTTFSHTRIQTHQHVNVRTCLLKRTQPVLKLEYSNTKCAFADTPKLILAHKMYGFPFHDKTGIFGISNRDSYVITGKLPSQLKRLKTFLSTKFALYVFEATRYRMRYLERYAFEFLPDVTRLEGFPDVITDITVADYFQLDHEEREAVNRINKKSYQPHLDYRMLLFPKN